MATTHHTPENRVKPEEVGKAVHYMAQRSEEELDALDAMERAWQLTLPSQDTVQELLELYPTAQNAAARMVRQKILDVKRHISDLSEVRAEWSNAINKMKPKTQPGFIEWLNEHIARRTEEYEGLLRRYQYELAWLKNFGNEEPLATRAGSVTKEEIERARMVPMKTFFKRKTEKCLWHDDNQPSLHIYKDHVFCFSCSKWADAIDIYMALNSVDFLTAVKALL